MTLVVGCATDVKSRSAVELAALFARSAGESVVVAAVVPQAPLPGMGRIDAEYRAFILTEARQALDAARAKMPADIEATYVVRESRSTSAGLLELAVERDARLIVLGSSSAGLLGQIAVGSVTSRLLHSSPVAIAVAPRGFHANRGDTLARVTAAYNGSPDQDALVLAAAAIATWADASLRLAAFAVRTAVPYTQRLGTEGDTAVMQQWTQVLRRNTAAALKRVSQLPTAPYVLETAIGYGQTWLESLDDIEWDGRDMLVVGSSSAGPLARVFLGADAEKILRYAPVPVVVVPRSALAG